MEKWELYDENGKKLFKTIYRGDELKENEYHISVHVWIINDKGEYLIQKRSPNKKKYPNMWAMTGGAVIYGENSQEACIRETHEELGLELDIDNLKKIGRIKKSNVFVDIWLAKKNCELNQLTLQEDEVSSVKWVNDDELNELITNNNLSSYAIAGLEMCRKYIQDK